MTTNMSLGAENSILKRIIANMNNIHTGHYGDFEPYCVFCGALSVYGCKKYCPHKHFILHAPDTVEADALTVLNLMGAQTVDDLYRLGAKDVLNPYCEAWSETRLARLDNIYFCYDDNDGRVECLELYDMDDIVGFTYFEDGRKGIVSKKLYLAVIEAVGELSPENLSEDGMLDENQINEKRERIIGAYDDVLRQELRWADTSLEDFNIEFIKDERNLSDESFD